MVISNRKPCLIIQSEPLWENCPACRNSKPPLGNFRTKTKRQFLKINAVSQGGDNNPPPPPSLP